jgi:hypothetical protein
MAGEEGPSPDIMPAPANRGWAEWAMVLAAIVMAGATCTLVWVGWLQWQTLDNTDMTQRVLQRAWISIPTIRFQPRVAARSGDYLDPWPTYDGDKVGFRLRFFLRNVGHIPAFDVRVEARVYLQTERQDEWKERQTDVCDRLRAKLVRREPSARYTILPEDVSFPYNVEPETIQKPATDYYDPVVVGCVAYRTAFDDKPHQTPFFGRISVVDSSKPVDPQGKPNPIKTSDRTPPKNCQLAVIHLGVAGEAD